MKKPDLEIANSNEIHNYIQYLESCLNGASDLIIELNLTSKVFANDLRLIREEDGDSATYIGKSDKTKRFEHAMQLFDKIDKIKALSSYFKGTEVEKPISSPIEERTRAFKVKNGNG